LPNSSKILIGLIAAALVAWINHGPAGNGQAYIDTLEAQARDVVKGTELPEIHVSVQRSPLAPVATLTGPADEFQRYGMGSQKGLTQMVGDVPGMNRVRWSDRPDDGITIPLLVESIALTLFAYLIGLGLGWLVWGRRRRPRYA